MRRFVLVAALALAFAGCGNAAYVKEAETEGVYVDVGNLTYQVQISRYLNPGSLDDAQYLIGAPPNFDASKQIWFGVWMRVKNYSDVTETPTNVYEITDTLGKKFEPVGLPNTNVFGYHAAPLGPSQVYPPPESAAANGPIQGSLVLFKIAHASIASRPLTLHIFSGADEATVSLDL